MPRTPPVRTLEAKVEVEPQRRRLRPTASIEGLRPAENKPPRRTGRADHPLSQIATLLRHPFQYRLARIAVEARWHPQGLAVGSTPAPVTDARIVASDDQDEATAAALLDRYWAVMTMVVAASFAVIISVVVAPRLRNADLPAYTESSPLVQQGAAIYASDCAACHGANLEGTLAHGLGPPPLDASGHAWLHSDMTLFQMVKFGTANCQPSAGQPQMPNFGDQLNDRSIQAVIAFIKSRWPLDTRIVQNAFNDGESNDAETQETVLCTAICEPPALQVGAR